MATVAEMKWNGKRNGVLLRLAEPEFDAFVTIDQGVGFQQRVGSMSIGVLVLSAVTNRLEDLRPLIPELLAKLGQIVPGAVVRVPS